MVRRALKLASTISIILTICVAVSEPALTQTDSAAKDGKRRLGAIDALKINSVGSVALSPDSMRVA